VLAPAPRLVEETRPRSVAVLEDPMIDVVTQVERLEPTARGTLTSTPIVHVLVYMLDHRQSGSVVLREADGRHHVVYFESGCPALVRNGRPLALLGDGMVAAGFLSPHVLSKALEVARRDGTLLGKYLVTSGLVTDEALRLALGAQIPRKLERMVNLPADTDYAFYSGVNLIPDWAGGEVFPCHPLTAILSAVRHWHDRARMRATLSRIMRQPLTFHPEVDLSSFILTGEEQAVIEAIQAESPTLSVLYDMRVAGEDAVSALVYTLAVTRGFAFTAGKGPPMVALPVLEEVPEALLEDDPGVAAGQGQLAERAPAHPVAWAEPSGSASSEPASAVPSAQSLVPPGSGGARPSESEGRPRQGGWRPDRVPLSKVVDPMGSAPRSLRSELGASPISGIGGAPSPHAAQSRRGPSGAGTGAPVDQAVLVQAMTDFRLAETALDRGQNVQAGELAKKALAAEPTNLEYAALVAWTNALGVQKDALPLAIAKLNVILQEDARCVRALLYRGRLYKRIKRSTEALRDFSAVLETDPRNAEAAMEVRLLRMKKK
jgi:hypothetical protein